MVGGLPPGFGMGLAGRVMSKTDKADAELINHRQKMGPVREGASAPLPGLIPSPKRLGPGPPRERASRMQETEPKEEPEESPDEEPPEEESPEPEEAEEEKEEPQEEPEETVAPSARIQEAIQETANFRILERLQSEAATKFRERFYLTAFDEAWESISEIDGTVRQYAEVSWAFALASAQRILESAKPSTKAAKAVRNHLKKGIDTLEADEFLENPKVLQALRTSLSTLYHEEMERHRQEVAALGGELGEVQSMGGDAGPAAGVLKRAVLALARDDRETYLELSEEAESLIKKAREARIAEIKKAAEAVSPLLREGVRQALERGDYVSAHYLVSMTQEEARSYLSEQAQDKKVVLVERIIAQIWPLIEEASVQGFGHEQAREDLEAAVEFVTQGRYADALRKARLSYQAVKAFQEGTEPGGVERGDMAGEEGSVGVPEGEAAPEGTLAEVEAGSGDLSPEPLLWCFECGSINVEVDAKENMSCQDCGAVLPLKARSEV